MRLKKLKFDGSVLIKEKPCFRYKIFSRKFTHSGCGMAFDGDGSQRFSNDFSQNVEIYGVENGSSRHSENQKKQFLHYS